MRNKTTYNRRNKLIYEYYCTRWGDGYRDKVIIEELHNQFHLEHKTLEDIIRMMRKQSQEGQTELPLEIKEDADETKQI
jgi:hypothetical protein